MDNEQKLCECCERPAKIMVNDFSEKPDESGIMLKREPIKPSHFFCEEHVRESIVYKEY